MKPIKTDADHQAALAEIDRLAVENPTPGTEDANRLEILATLVEAYEKNHFPIEKPTPAEAIELRMDQLGLKQKDLEAYIGSRSRVSEVLSGKRSLTLRMIRALSKELGIPLEVLLQEPPRSLPPDIQIDWQKFPLHEMSRRGWIDSTPDEFIGQEEEWMRSFLAPVEDEDLVSVLYRRTEFAERSGRRMDPYALVAWSARVLMLAKNQQVEKYVPGTVTGEFMRNVARCSWSEKGPLLAQEYLANHGIHLIIEPHLPRTYLDGSACLMMKRRSPVIGMTIRHDRLDNFWFVLLHELGHTGAHLDVETDGTTKSFFDDLDVESQDTKEQEVDRLAAEALIPPHEWAKFMARPVSPDGIAELANALTINPVIVAGRYQHETKNYRRFSRMLGRHSVRRLFPEVAW